MNTRSTFFQPSLSSCHLHWSKNSYTTSWIILDPTNNELKSALNSQKPNMSTNSWILNSKIGGACISPYRETLWENTSITKVGVSSRSCGDNSFVTIES